MRGQLAQNTKLQAARESAVFGQRIINAIRPVDPDQPGESSGAGNPGNPQDGR